MQIEWNKSELERLQREADKHVQDIVRRAVKDLKGKSTSSVKAELTRRLKAGGIEPNSANIHKLAAEISKGTVVE